MDLLLEQRGNLGLAGTREYPWELHWTNVKVTAQPPPLGRCFSFFMNIPIPLNTNRCLGRKTFSTEEPFKTDLAYDTH